MSQNYKKYHAIIWPNPSNPTGDRTTVIADSLESARAALQQQYGKESIFSIWREPDPESTAQN